MDRLIDTFFGWWKDWVGSEGWVSSEDWAYFVDDQEDFLNLEALQTEKVKRPR